MYTQLGNVHQGRLGSAVINPFDGQVGLWKYGFGQDEEEQEKRLVTPDNPRSIYNGYAGLDGVGFTVAGGAVGAAMAVAALAVAWKLKKEPRPLVEKLKSNWYCIAGGAAMLVVWESLSGKFRA